MPDIEERHVTLTFGPGDARPGGREFIARHHGLVVIPCEECCPTLLFQLRQSRQQLEGLTLSVDLERRVKHLQRSEFYVAHESRQDSPFPVFDGQGKLTISSDADYEFFSFGGGYAGSASCMLVSDGETAFLVDCGVSVGLLSRSRLDSSCPSPLPDFDGLLKVIEERKLKLEGIFATHLHLDHIWAIYDFFSRLGRNDVPVYGDGFTTMFASQLVEQRQAEAQLDATQTYHLKTERLNPWQEVKVGRFTLQAFPVFHSVPGSVGFIIRPADNRGALVITGDYKARYDSPLDCLTFRKDLAEIGQVKLLVGDATNAEIPGYTDLESAVNEGMINALRGHRGQKIISMISSNLGRLSNIYNLCRLMGKSIAICGNSLERAVDVYRSSGSVMPRLVSADPAESEVVVVTGCQADPGSVLERLSRGQSVEGLRLLPSTRVIMSSRAIPGRENDVTEMIDRIRELGVEIFTNEDQDSSPHGASDWHQHTTHVSGHGCSDDIFDTVEALEPEYYLPTHCNPSAKASAAQIALEASPNMTTANIILPNLTTYNISW